jgi:hypothetical protein
MMDKRTSYFFALAVVAALVAAGCATAPAVEIMMDPDAPVTEAPPVYDVGSSWTTNHTVNGEAETITSTIVEKAEIDARVVDVHSYAMPENSPGFACDGANGGMFDAVTHNWKGCLKDGEVMASLSPHNGQYEWPLEVGKSWRAERTWTDNVLHPDYSGPGWEEFTVVAWEEVTVPAGTFMAYKVVRTRAAWETTSVDSSVNWYAPEYGGSIKAIWVRGKKDGYGPAENMWEAVSADRKYPSES